MLIETGRSYTTLLRRRCAKADYLKYEAALAPFRFSWNERLGQYIARCTEELETSPAAANQDRRILI